MKIFHCFENYNSSVSKTVATCKRFVGMSWNLIRFRSRVGSSHKLYGIIVQFKTLQHLYLHILTTETYAIQTLMSTWLYIRKFGNKWMRQVDCVKQSISRQQTLLYIYYILCFALLTRLRGHFVYLCPLFLSLLFIVISAYFVVDLFGKVISV